MFHVDPERSRSLLRRLLKAGVIEKCGWFYSADRNVACKRWRGERIQPHRRGSSIAVLRALKAGYATVEEIAKVTGLRRSQIVPALVRVGAIASAGRYPFRVYALKMDYLEDRIIQRLPPEAKKILEKIRKRPIPASNLPKNLRSLMFQLVKDGIIDSTRVRGKIVFHKDARPEEILQATEDDNLAQLRGIMTERRIRDWLTLQTGLKFRRYKNFDAIAWLLGAPIVVEIKDEKRLRGSEVTEFYNKVRKEFGPGALMFIVVTEKTRIAETTKKMAEEMGIHIVVTRS